MCSDYNTLWQSSLYTKCVFDVGTSVFTDNLNCLQSVTLQKETVAFLKSELRLAEQLQQRQAEELNKLQQQLHNGKGLS